MTQDKAIPLNQNLNGGRIWLNVLLPFCVSRLILLIAGWVAHRVVPMGQIYAEKAPWLIERGWEQTSTLWIDMWAHWDANWYKGIAHHGYLILEGIETHQENIAFFPLYPYLMRLVQWLLPVESTNTLLIIGILLSNLFFLGALYLLYRLMVEAFNNPSAARRAVWLLALFPTTLFFSAVYSESTFLFFTLAAFFFAHRRSWPLASLAGFFAALTRVPGVVLLAPLGWMYLDSIQWKLNKIRWNVLWLALIPAGLLAFLLHVYPLTGNLLAPIQAQAAWTKQMVMPWQTVFNSSSQYLFITQIDQICVFAGLFLAGYALFKLPSKAYGLYALILLFTPLFTGNLRSYTRYSMVIFPLFIMGAILLRKKPILFITIITIFLVVMIFYMFGWTRFYWVG